MTKLHLFFGNVEKEERWIDAVQQKGYRLVRADPSFGRYHFERCQVPPPDVRLDYRAFENKAAFLDYVTLFADSGWRHLGGSYQSGLQVFAKASPDAETEIFSDGASKAEMYSRMGGHLLTMSVILFPIWVVICTTGMLDISRMLNPKAQYFTPGLWEEQGFTFWRQFLFETPFALGRAYGGLLLLVLMLVPLVASGWAYWKYHRAKAAATPAKE